MQNSRINARMEETPVTELVSEMMKVKPIILEDKIEKLLREGYEEEVKSTPKVPQAPSDRSPDSHTILSGELKSNYPNKEEIKDKELVLDVSEPTPQKQIEKIRDLKGIENTEILLKKTENRKEFKAPEERSKKMTPVSQFAPTEKQREEIFKKEIKPNEDNVDIKDVRSQDELEAREEEEIIPLSQTKNVSVTDLVFTNDNNEKPSFFETSVEIPPYLKASMMRQKADKIQNKYKEFANNEDIDYTLKDYIEENAEFTDIQPADAKDHPNYMKITGKGKYYNYKDFMQDYFEHRELVAMQPLDRITRIQKSREFYKHKKL